MAIKSKEELEQERKRLTEMLTNELPILRARLKISQAELSHRIGISRQTYSLIETNKQEMSWVTFMALIAFFSSNEKTKKELANIGLVTDSSYIELTQI